MTPIFESHFVFDYFFSYPENAKSENWWLLRNGLRNTIHSSIQTVSTGCSFFEKKSNRFAIPFSGFNFKETCGAFLRSHKRDLEKCGKFIIGLKNWTLFFCHWKDFNFARYCVGEQHYCAQYHIQFIQKEMAWRRWKNWLYIYLYIKLVWN